MEENGKTSENSHVKLACIGGGSMFVPSIVNGVGAALLENAVSYEVDIALFDIDANRAVVMSDYARVVRDAWNVPINASVSDSRHKALEGADVVLVSVRLPEQDRFEELLESLGIYAFEPDPAISAVASAPWCLDLAAEVEKLCPDALFVTLMNPTDVLAKVVHTGGGISAIGLCVEVDQLRAELAQYFDVNVGDITFKHAGVNHDGWVLELEVAGQDGYSIWKDRWNEIEDHPDVHPGNLWLRPVIELTGHLRTSGHHYWPLTLDPTPEYERVRSARQGLQPDRSQALQDAVQTRIPISDPPKTLTSRSKLLYPHTGRTIGRLLASFATGKENVLPLQVMNRGSIANFPDDVVVEVPTRVQGRSIVPIQVGILPDWLGGYTRLLAIQRKLVAEYILCRDLSVLKQALATLPMFGSVQKLLQLAEHVHREFTSAM